MANDGTHNPIGAFNLNPVALSVAHNSNSFVDGQIFTISGAGFGTKAQAAPVLFDDFKSYTAGQALQTQSANWNQYQTNGGALVVDTSPRYAGSKSAYNDSTRDGFATCYHTSPTPSDVAYLSYWYSVDATWGSGDAGTYWVGKLGRITSSVAAGGGGVYNERGAHIVSNQNPYYSSDPAASVQGGTYTTGTLSYPDFPSDSSWVRVDMFVKLATIDMADGLFDVRVLGRDRNIHTGLTNRTSTGDTYSGNYQIDSTILGVMHANHGNLGVGSDAFGAMRVSDVYFDFTRKRVELSDNADFSLSTKLEVQPAVTWQDDQIQITVNKGAMPSGTAWLHVLDEDETVLHSQQVTVA